MNSVLSSDKQLVTQSFFYSNYHCLTDSAILVTQFTVALRVFHPLLDVCLVLPGFHGTPGPRKGGESWRVGNASGPSCSAQAELNLSSPPHGKAFVALREDSRFWWNIFQPQLKTICAEITVAFVVLPAFFFGIKHDKHTSSKAWVTHRYLFKSVQSLCFFSTYHFKMKAKGDWLFVAKLFLGSG